MYVWYVRMKDMTKSYHFFKSHQVFTPPSIFMYGVRNLEKTIRFSLKSRPSERFHWPEMSQIKAEISLRTNVKLIFHKNVGWQGYQWIP